MDSTPMTAVRPCKGTCRASDSGSVSVNFPAGMRRLKAHAATLKEVKLRPRTDDHDLAFKLRNARRFLIDGDKVKVTVMFRGREMVHRGIGEKQLQRVTQMLGPIATVENPPRMEGRFLSMILVPNRDAVAEALRAERRALKQEAAARAEAPPQQEEVAVGTATDPYQPAEGRYRLTRTCIGELAHAWTPFSLITRGPLVVRDIDVLQEAAERVPVSVTVSLPTLDDRVWRTTEPGTAPPRSRLEAVRRLADAGIDVGVGLAPILPGLSDDPEQLRAVVRAAKAAGARTVWAAPVHLRPGVREHFLAALERDWPELVPRYEELFSWRAYLPNALTQPLREHVRAAARAVPIREGYRRTERREPVRPAQLTLAV